jgi:quercetin dioxygenase-like cupin family protein
MTDPLDPADARPCDRARPEFSALLVARKDDRRRRAVGHLSRCGAGPLAGTLASQPAAYCCEPMAKTGDTFTLSPKERLTITSSAADSGGELLAMEAQYAPGGSPPPEHYHPTQEETFTGVSGTVTARIGGVERRIGPGEMVTIRAGTRHAFWNPGTEPATIKWEVRPALSTERMFEELSNAGSTFKQALVILRYKREFRLSNAPQRMLLDAIAPIARLVAH